MLFPGQLWRGRRLGNCVPKKCLLVSFSAASLRSLVFSFPCLPSGHTTARSAARVIKSQQFSWFRFLGKRSPSLGAARAASSTTRHALSLRSEAGRAKSDGTPLPQVVAVAGVPEGNMGSYFATAGPLRRRQQKQQQQQRCSRPLLLLVRRREGKGRVGAGCGGGAKKRQGQAAAGPAATQTAGELPQIVLAVRNPGIRNPARRLRPENGSRRPSTPHPPRSNGIRVPFPDVAQSNVSARRGSRGRGRRRRRGRGRTELKQRH